MTFAEDIFVKAGKHLKYLLTQVADLEQRAEIQTALVELGVLPYDKTLCTNYVMACVQTMPPKRWPRPYHIIKKNVGIGDHAPRWQSFCRRYVLREGDNILRIEWPYGRNMLCLNCVRMAESAITKGMTGDWSDGTIWKQIQTIGIGQSFDNLVKSVIQMRRKRWAILNEQEGEEMPEIDSMIEDALQRACLEDPDSLDQLCSLLRRRGHPKATVCMAFVDDEQIFFDIQGLDFAKLTEAMEGMKKSSRGSKFWYTYLFPGQYQDEDVVPLSRFVEPLDLIDTDYSLKGKFDQRAALRREKWKNFGQILYRDWIERAWTGEQEIELSILAHQWDFPSPGEGDPKPIVSLHWEEEDASLVQNEGWGPVVVSPISREVVEMLRDSSIVPLGVCRREIGPEYTCTPEMVLETAVYSSGLTDKEEALYESLLKEL